MNIPDAAVQAAVEKDAEIAGRTFSGFSKYEKQRFLDRAKNMLTAALSHLKPFDVSTVRRQAFKDACKILEHEADEFGDLVDEVSYHLLRKAKIIRSLSAETSPEAGQ